MNITLLIQLLKLAPAIIEAVIAVEHTIVGERQGAQRKAVVLDCIEAVAKAGETVDNKLVSMVSTYVDRIVQTFNSSGLFSTSPAAANK